MEHAHELYHQGYKTPTALLLASLILHLLLLYWCLQQGILEIEQFLPNFGSETAHEWAANDADEIADTNLPAALRAGTSTFGVPVTWVPDSDDNQITGSDEQENDRSQECEHEDLPSLNFGGTGTETKVDSQETVVGNEQTITSTIDNQGTKERSCPSIHSTSSNTPAVAKAMARRQDEREKQMPNQNVADDGTSLFGEQNSLNMSAAVAEAMPDYAEATTGRPGRRRKKMRARTRSGSDVGTRRLTIADLANGFLDSIRGDGPDLADRAGDPNKRPDAEEMKKLNYLYTLVWNMQNEWRIKSHKLKLLSNDPFYLTVKIVINRDGRLHHIAVLESTGTPHYDEFIIKGIKRASPYPPVPSYIKTDLFDVTITFTFNSQMPDYAQSQLMGSSLLKGRP